MRDPRNDEDYDTWDVGMEPIPGDKTWTRIGELSRKLEAGTREGSVLGARDSQGSGFRASSTQAQNGPGLARGRF